MPERRTAATDVDSYLADVPEAARAALEKVRKAVRDTAPDADELLSYQMPAFKYQGKPLAYFAAFTNHCSFFPASGAVIDAHKDELKPYSMSKGTIRFPASKPLPATLVRKLVKARIAEINAQAAARASARRRRK